MTSARTCRIALPHFFQEQPGGTGYGSGRVGQRLQRSLALARCVQALQALTRRDDDLALNIGRRNLNQTGIEARATSLKPDLQEWQIEVNIFTTGMSSRLEDVLQALPGDIRVHTAPLENPRELPLACRDWLISSEPIADLSLYLEDDLVINDPLFLDKQLWFLRRCAGEAVLMPHRWEPIPGSGGQRLLVDGPLRPEFIQQFTQPQNAIARGNFRGEEITFDRTSNPHAGCFCLNKQQIERLRNLELPREGFISPLETAATLTVLKYFQVLKPSLEQRRFLWVEHGHPSFQGYAKQWSVETPKQFKIDSVDDVISDKTNHAAASCSQLGLHFPDQHETQQPVDVAIIMPTILRPVITRAIRSIYEQDFGGRIQILIGVDKPFGDLELLQQCLQRRPGNISATVLTLPWSTSIRHGGIHQAMDAGSLRTILSFMANSRLVTYLDDDNSILPTHIRMLFNAIQGKAWAFTHRMLIDEKTDRKLAVDRWDSLGPNQGRMAKQGGFVDTNCLMLDKLACGRALSRWSEGPGVASDRSLFASIRNAPYGTVSEATVNYYIRENSIFHQFIKTDAKF